MSDQQKSACPDMANVVEQHKKLEPFVGTFHAEVKLWMGPGEPFVSTGTMVNSWDLGGRFLRQDYKGDPNDGPFPNFEGRGFWGYNTIDQRYEGFWIDSASTFMQFESGQLDDADKTWSMTGQMTDPTSGAQMTKRSVITLKDNDHHSMELFFSPGGGPEVKAMEIQYARKK